MMDAAVMRGGRIDHRIGVGPPDEAARTAILKDVQRPEGHRHAEAGLEELARLADRFSRSELERAAKQLFEKGGWTSPKAARGAAAKLVDELQPSLTIKPQMMSDFVDDRSEFGNIPRKEE
jgi:SpoVK/Ycf46/Vps4 family AAA+-type ATPase